VSGTAVPEIRLVNNIAAQFGHLPPDLAAEETANHVRKFWDPRMKARLIDLAAGGDSDLKPVAYAAARLVRDTATAPTPAAEPETRFLSVRTADGRLEVDVAAPQSPQGLRNAFGVEVGMTPTAGLRGAIEEVTTRWTTAEALLALDREDVPARAATDDSGLAAR
jgi:formate dehydrogenase subunit delta